MVVFGFARDGVRGSVRVDCVLNDHPADLGCPPEARGFPVCTASVGFPGLGYRSLFGWVQLVRSTDNSSGGQDFEPDPFTLFADAPSPYCWYGTAPTLFDAPHRETRSPLTWVAHTFLATTPLEEAARAPTKPVVPLLGFSWGFEVREGLITMRPVSQLAGRDWDGHLQVLRLSHPGWSFPGASTSFSGPVAERPPR